MGHPKSEVFRLAPRDAAGEETVREKPQQKWHLWNTDGPFPDGTPVAVRYPTGRGDGDIGFAGTVVGRFGTNEWEVALDDPRMASGQESSPLFRWGDERLKVLTDREWSELVDEAYRSVSAMPDSTRLSGTPIIPAEGGQAPCPRAPRFSLPVSLLTTARPGADEWRDRWQCRE